MKKIWAAVPCYTGEITVETASSLFAEFAHAMANKIGFCVEFCPYNPMIHYVRNFLCRKFLETDYTDMVFIDADVGWKPGTLCQLAAYPVDIVGAVYPHRGEPEGYPIRYIPERTELSGVMFDGFEKPLLEVEGLPAGCLRISRRALEVIQAKFPQNVYADMEGIKTYSFFEFSKERGGFNGEDWHFCLMARDAGLKIWCDPELDMTHTGTKTFRGNLGKHLRARVAAQDTDAAMANIMKFAGVKEAA